MKDKSQFKKIDEYGRLQIPTEIRKAVNLSCGDMVGLSVYSDGNIIIKKFSEREVFEKELNLYLKLFFQVYRAMSLIIDKNGCLISVIADNFIKNTSNSKDIKSLLSIGIPYYRKQGNEIYYIDGQSNTIIDAVIPIQNGMSNFGYWIIFGQNKDTLPIDKEKGIELMSRLIQQVIDRGRL